MAKERGPEGPCCGDAGFWGFLLGEINWGVRGQSGQHGVSWAPSDWLAESFSRKHVLFSCEIYISFVLAIVFPLKGKFATA